MVGITALIKKSIKKVFQLDILYGFVVFHYEGYPIPYFRELRKVAQKDWILGSLNSRSIYDEQ